MTFKVRVQRETHGLYPPSTLPLPHPYPKLVMRHEDGVLHINKVTLIFFFNNYIRQYKYCQKSKISWIFIKVRSLKVSRQNDY